MVSLPDPDDEHLNRVEPPSPEDRLWRHPSELGGSGSTGAAGRSGATSHLAAGFIGTNSTPPADRRTSNLGAIAGVCLASALVAFAALWLTRPTAEEDQRRVPFMFGVSATLVTTSSAPVASAANPIQRAQISSITSTLTPSAGGRLGVDVADATVADGGAMVVEAWPDGSAAVAGLRRGDVIVALNDATVTDASALLAALSTTSPGDVVAVSVLRDGDEMQMLVSLG